MLYVSISNVGLQKIVMYIYLALCSRHCHKHLAIAISQILFHSPQRYLTFVSDDVYDKSELSHCTGHIYRLISCLTDGKPHIFESRKCDNFLSQTVMCLAAYRPENQLGPVPLETEDDFGWNVSKRGLGKCIHKCLNGQGRMNFIQCKNMCHR